MASASPRTATTRRIRRNLLLAALMTHVLGALVAFGVSMWVRQETFAPSMEPVLVGAYYLALALCAVVDALVADEWLFDGSFRWMVLKGTTADNVTARASVDELVAATRRPHLSFPVSVIVAGLVNVVVFNASSRDFGDYYEHTGKHIHTLRGDDDEGSAARLEACKTLSLNTRPPAVRALIRATEHPDPTTAAWAAWALGRQHATTYANRLIEPLHRALDQGPPPVQREAAIALARIQHRAARGAVIEALDGELRAGGPVDARLVWSLGYLQHMDSLEVLTAALDASAPTDALAAWALAQLRDEVGGRQAVPVLERRLLHGSFERACAIVHALSVLGDERSNLVLMQAFDARDAATLASVCPVQEIRTSPTLDDDHRILVRPETYAMKTLIALGRVRATSPEMRAIVEPWLEALIATPGHSLATRQAAQNLLEGIQGGRDDLAAPARATP